MITIKYVVFASTYEYPIGYISSDEVLHKFIEQRKHSTIHYGFLNKKDCKKETFEYLSIDSEFTELIDGSDYIINMDEVNYIHEALHELQDVIHDTANTMAMILPFIKLSEQEEYNVSLLISDLIKIYRIISGKDKDMKFFNIHEFIKTVLVL